MSALKNVIFIIKTNYCLVLDVFLWVIILYTYTHRSITTKKWKGYLRLRWFFWLLCTIRATRYLSPDLSICSVWFCMNIDICFSIAHCSHQIRELLTSHWSFKFIGSYRASFLYFIRRTSSIRSLSLVRFRPLYRCECAPL
jgi:hypothetical protein